MKKWKKGLLIGGAVIIAGLGFGYFHFLGRTVSTTLSDKVHIVSRENLFDQIGAKIVAIDTGTSWVLVDTHLGFFAESALQEIKSISDQPIEAAFITHWHPDHSEGIQVFNPEARIIAHENVANILSRDRVGYGLTGPGSVHEYKAVSGDKLPDETFNDTLTLNTGEITFEAVHFSNAHTDGDAVIFIQDLSVVVVGDLVWPEGFPYVDVHNGGTVAGLLSAFDRILERVDENATIISGHGDPMTKAELADYRNVVFQTFKLVEEKKNAGEPLEAIISAGLPDVYTEYSTSLVPEGAWIEMIFTTLP